MTRRFTALVLLALLAPVAAAHNHGDHDKKKGEATKVSEKERLAALEKQFGTIDKSRDGKLRGEEIPKGWLARFDRSGDDTVTKKEFLTVMARPEGFRRLLILRDVRARAMSAMRFDRDKDGLVSSEEFAGDRNAFKKYDRNKDGHHEWKELLRQAGDQLDDLKKRAKNPSRYEMLDLFDLNYDRQITKAEYDGPSRAFRKYDENDDGVVDYYEATGRMMGGEAPAPTLEDANVIKSMDTNEDGRVSREEWKGTEAAWKRMDKNGDGWISIADAR